MKKIALLTLFACCTSVGLVSAQMVNTGQQIHIESNGLIFINGDYSHVDGDISGDGGIELKGDWNNISAGAVFSNSAAKIKLNGTDQYIKGFKTVFPTLTLAGTGEKSLETDAAVSHNLILNDRQLNVKSFSLSVLNTTPSAIQRSSGFVSTDGGGSLVRNTNSTSSYLFPLGSSKNNSAFINVNQADVNPLYRPVTIEPDNSGQNTFSATLNNYDPNSNFSRSSKSADIDQVSDKYYYLLSHIKGSSRFTTRFYQNLSVENNSAILGWDKATSRWEKFPTTSKDELYGDGLNRSLSFASLAGVNNLPISFSNSPTASNPFKFFNAFSPDGDGKNDRWLIPNIEQFPDNNLSIFNRWGDEVFKVSNYSDSNAWDGSNLQSGTYFYVLNVKINGKQQTFKGFITMVKKN